LGAAPPGAYAPGDPGPARPIGGVNASAWRNADHTRPVSGDPSSGAASGDVGSKRRENRSIRPRGSFLTPALLPAAKCVCGCCLRASRVARSSHPQRRRRGGFAVDSYVAQLARAVRGARRRASRPDPRSLLVGERDGASADRGPLDERARSPPRSEASAAAPARAAACEGAESPRDRDRIRICSVPAAGSF